MAKVCRAAFAFSGLPPAAQKNVSVARPTMRSRVSRYTLEAFGCAIGDRDDTVPAILRVPDPDDGSAGVHIRIVQREGPHRCACR